MEGWGSVLRSVWVSFYVRSFSYQRSVSYQPVPRIRFLILLEKLPSWHSCFFEASTYLKYCFLFILFFYFYLTSLFNATRKKFINQSFDLRQSLFPSGLQNYYQAEQMAGMRTTNTTTATIIPVSQGARDQGSWRVQASALGLENKFSSILFLFCFCFSSCFHSMCLFTITLSNLDTVIVGLLSIICIF